MIEIIKAPDDVRPYLDDVKALADGLERELGFIPYSAYHEHHLNGNLFVATVVDLQGEKSFAGYVLFGGRFPTKKIFQLAVVPRYRRMEVGKSLVDAVVQKADERGFYELFVRVGKTLPANKFWERAQFSVVDVVKGGRRHALLNLRVRAIRPSLFSDFPSKSDLQVAADNIVSRAPLYFLDTNVVLDISTRHTDSNKVSKNLRYLMAEGEIQFAIAQEAVSELERHYCPDDPALETARKLVRFPLGTARDLRTRLKKVVFPSKDKIGQHDASDIEHIATAISCGAKGFVTRDKGILKREEVLCKQFSLEVLSPADFWGESALQDLDELRMSTITTGESLKISPGLDEESKKRIRAIRPKHTIDDKKFSYASLRIEDRLTLNCAMDKTLPAGRRPWHVVLFIWENTTRSVSTMLDYVSERARSSAQPITISLAFHGWDKPIANVLLDRGYYKSDDGVYGKIFAGPVIGEQNWQAQKKAIERLGKISLPDMPLDYDNLRQNIALGRKHGVPLQALEDFLSAVLVLPSRDGAIIPIKAKYAKALFGHSSQLPLWPLDAHLNAYKSYFGTHRAASCLQPGKLLFFYQSTTKDSPGQIIAFARIVHSNLAVKDEHGQSARDRGVLDKDSLKDITKTDKVLETVFTHSTLFPKAVALNTLRKIGCAGKANFITAFGIDHQQVCRILKEGGLL